MKYGILEIDYIGMKRHLTDKETRNEDVYISNFKTKGMQRINKHFRQVGLLR
ncbi:hypothetical protein Plhal304r1_c079g0165321 [Plasmopara halstedii]